MKEGWKMSEQKKQAKTGLSFVWGVVTGAVVGGVSALLFAPKKGSELRSDIKDGTSKAVEASSQALQTVTQKTTEVAKVVENKASELVDDAKQVLLKLVKKEEVVEQIQAEEIVQATEVQEEAVHA